MKFGKVDDIEHIDFSLPLPSYHIKSAESKRGLKLYMGATAWIQKAWKGDIYPLKTKASDFLHHYADFFGTIELNSTFYTIPKKEGIIKWKEQTRDSFKFCPKVYRGISHSKDFGISSGNFDRYLDSIVFFEEKLGACFLQLPEYFDLSRKERLFNFLSKWPSEIPLSIEIRNSELLNARDISWMKELDFLSLLHLDVAGRRDLVHGRVYGDVQVIRWVGNAMHPSDLSRAEEWHNLIHEWSKNGVKEVYLLLHQPDNILTPKISSYFRDLMSEQSNISVEPSSKKLPSQAKLF